MCEPNFTGSVGAMEPAGVLSMFSRSLNFSIRYMLVYIMYMHLICDGDATTHSLSIEESPYGEEHTVWDVFKRGWALLSRSLEDRNSLIIRP